MTLTTPALRIEPRSFWGTPTAKSTNPSPLRSPAIEAGVAPEPPAWADW